MKIVYGKIVEATRDELIDYFMRHIDAGDSLGAFILRCKDNGTKIIKEGDDRVSEKTHAEIVAECYHNTAATRYVRNLLDRLDAAHKRDVDALRQRCAELDAEVAAKDEVIKRLNDAIAEEQRRHLATTEKSSAVGDCAKLREAISNLRTALKEIRDDVLDMVMNHKSEDPDSYAHGLCLSIGGACDMALNFTKEFDDGNE